MKDKEKYRLIERLKKGDLEALKQVYEAYYYRLLRFAKRFQLQKLTPEDFVQQTFLQLWEKRKLLKEHVLLDKQIFTICKNNILNHLTREKKTVAFNLNKENQPLGSEDEHDLETIRLERILKEVERLPEKRREIFKLHKMEGLSYNEISQKLHISKSTIANHIYLATVHLKKVLKD